MVSHSSSRKAFLKNRRDVERLWEIHEEVAGAGRGRKHGVEVLNRSTLVLIAACWEAYVEDLVIEGYGRLHAAGATVAGTPKNLTAARNRAGKLNTPFAKKVDALFRDILGLKDVSNFWRWQRMSSARAVSKLDRFITDRCVIAHRVSGMVRTPKSSGNSFLDHVDSLIDCTDGAVFDYLEGRLGHAPW
jgi:hypothetical protein